MIKNLILKPFLLAGSCQETWSESEVTFEMIGCDRPCGGSPLVRNSSSGLEAQAALLQMTIFKLYLVAGLNPKR